MQAETKNTVKNNSFLKAIKNFTMSGIGSVVIALVLLLIVMGIGSDKFFTQSNITAILRQASAMGIMACAITPIIICGNVDLSVSSILSFCALMSVKLADQGSLAKALIFPLLVAVACGIVNGVMVGFFRFHPFIATLASQSVFQAIALFYSDGAFLETSDIGFYSKIGKGAVGPIPMPVVLLIVVFIIISVLMKKTVFGRRVYMVGGNVECAKYSGISYFKTVLVTYIISAVATCISAYILATRQLAAQPEMGVGYEFDSIAAVVVGGTALSGGKGSVLGSLLGVLFITIVKNAFVLLEISLYYQQIVLGVLLLAAVVIQAVNEGRAANAK